MVTLSGVEGKFLVAVSSYFTHRTEYPFETGADSPKIVVPDGNDNAVGICSPSKIQ
jgi:hypothetical protein